MDTVTVPQLPAMLQAAGRLTTEASEDFEPGRLKETHRALEELLLALAPPPDFFFFPRGGPPPPPPRAPVPAVER